MHSPSHLQVDENVQTGAAGGAGERGCTSVQRLLTDRWTTHDTRLGERGRKSEKQMELWHYWSPSLCRRVCIMQMQVCWTCFVGRDASRRPWKETIDVSQRGEEKEDDEEDVGEWESVGDGVGDSRRILLYFVLVETMQSCVFSASLSHGEDS
ncbi:uncharacterized protein SPSK_04595 [Sporothrix schenckii 1099-18]|uniref:Uncharacterized protein n=1 Tax=Sporothrix schenckii 1099-18 TaxID=1397361 RepID=A0A0F2M3V5_SPOSC|nr:uncharacterized protein SPSK_04595 [Sporothrix schenckii 1099-18]KJR83450.1 hypothetical protein SPSK_04595 [Sporothrix schenckii 1099-18]